MSDTPIHDALVTDHARRARRRALTPGHRVVAVVLGVWFLVLMLAVAVGMIR